MNQLEFIKLVNVLRETSGYDTFDPPYYIFIKKGLRNAVVNRTGYINMSDVAYVIVVIKYRWQNMGYVNSSLTTLLMTDHEFNAVESIPFGEWNMTLEFTGRYGDWYNKYAPYPVLTLASDPDVNTNVISDKGVHANLKGYDIMNFTANLTAIHKFIDRYNRGETISTQAYDELSREEQEKIDESYN